MFLKKTKVVLDTNTLLLLNEGIDIFSLINDALNEPYTLCTTQGVLDELERMMVKKSKQGFAAKLGYILAKQKDLKILQSSLKTHVDDAIVDLATPKRHIVATQDRELIQKLLEKGVRVLRYEQHHMVLRR